MSNKYLIVGLGNPGRQYENTRHNVGFWVVAELARRHNLSSPTSERKSFVMDGTIAGKRVIAALPQTYMNLSGEAVVAWAARAGEAVSGAPWPPPVPEPDEGQEPEPAPDPGPEPIRPLVICDDLALPLGAVRLRGKGSSGGQNGVQSIIEHIGGEIFPRLRLGIAPQAEVVPPEFWPDYVLADFEPEEREAVAEVVGHAADTVEFWLKHGTESTGSRFNRKRSPSPE